MVSKGKNSKRNLKKDYSNLGKRAGYLFVAGVALFLIIMSLAQLSYPCKGAICYNIGTNPISDLGNTLSSPLWPLFNYSLVIFGLMFFTGIILMIDLLPRNFTGRIGIIFLELSALCAIGVGTVPENTILSIHSLFALIAFGAGGIGLLLTGLAISSENGAGLYSSYSIISGIFVLILLFLFTIPIGLIPHLSTFGAGFGFGAVERLIAAPLFLWIFVTGVRLLLLFKDD